MYQRILVPIDGSDTAQRGLGEAIRLAAEQKAQLRLLHVVSDAYVNMVLMGGAYPGDLLETIRTGGESILDDGLRAARDGGARVEAQLLEHTSANIGAAIIEEAERFRADLIVMGTHGRRGLARTVMGSDAEYVLRHTPVPLLLLRLSS